METAPEGTPLYVHLPFCAAKCRYCDLFSVAEEGHDIDAMVEAILVEAEGKKIMVHVGPRRPDGRSLLARQSLGTDRGRVATPH